MRLLPVALTGLLLAALAVPVAAIYFYRGPGGGCSPADGALGTPATLAGGAVLMGHNSFHDLETGTPVTLIAAGESVTWYWWSSHCHSARAADLSWTSGFHYPSTPPASPAAVPGLMHYPLFDGTPDLSFTRTFPTAGTYSYNCENHSLIGMTGVVVVT